MKILIAYGTYSGSTLLVAELIKHKLEKLGHTAELLDMNMATATSFTGYDAYILGSNTWFENDEEGMMHSAFLRFKEESAGKPVFAGAKISIYALGDSTQYLQFCKAADHLESMVKELGGAVVTTPLKLSQYFLDTHTKEKDIDEWLGRTLKGFIGS